MNKAQKRREQQIWNQMKHCIGKTTDTARTFYVDQEGDNKRDFTN